MDLNAGQPALTRSVARAIPAIAPPVRKPGFVDAVAPMERGSRIVANGKNTMNAKFAKGNRQQRAMPPTPDIDPDNEEFVVFCRSAMIGNWIPCTMIKGNSATNELVKQFLGDTGASMARDTMIR